MQKLYKCHMQHVIFIGILVYVLNTVIDTINWLESLEEISAHWMLFWGQ